MDDQSASGLSSIRHRSLNPSPRGPVWESASPAGTTPQCPALTRSPEDAWNGQRNARERKKERHAVTPGSEAPGNASPHVLLLFYVGPVVSRPHPDPSRCNR